MDLIPFPGTRPEGAAADSPRPDFERFLAELASSRDYRGQIRHVEHLPARPARYADPDPPLPGGLREALAARGVERFYTHQAATLAAARAGTNAVTVTGTASGKTVGFLAPLLETLESESGATALLLYPTKALSQDQHRGILRLVEDHPALRGRVTAGVYDGDTAQGARRKIRNEAHLVLTNPDMLHRGILPYHGRWHRLLRNLRYVIVDEIHTYRGIFGANVGNVFRRLRRIVRHHGGDPVWLASSATIRNPVELCETLTGLPFTLVDEDGAPRGAKTFCLWNPPYQDASRLERRSGNAEAKDLLVKLVERGTASIVFTRARVVAELIYRYAREDLSRRRAGLGDALTPYRGGYLPSERRAIERRLFAGELLGVVSTNALELGIDIGELDASILVGFPGTVASVWQQAGRAGRTARDALTVFVGYDDPIDQYLLHHPEYFFSRNPEAAVCDPENPYVLAGHLGCAAFELPLGEGDADLFGDTVGDLRAILREGGELHAVGDTDYWSDTEVPARRVSLRTMSDDTYTIVDADHDDDVIGTVDAISALELVYPEAIYLHRGETYFVTELDLDKRVARVNRVAADYYTQPVLDASIRARGERDRRAPDTAPGEAIAFLDADVSWATTMFKKIRFGSQDSIGYKNLDLPGQTLSTVALAWCPSPAATARVRDAGRKPREGLQGVRNLLVTVLPLLSMCDRLDIGGIVESSNTGRPTLFLYDRFAGGLGFVERGFHEFEDLCARAHELVAACPCEDGCPSCVGLPLLHPPLHQDPDLQGGPPIPDKHAARELLEALARP